MIGPTAAAATWQALRLRGCLGRRGRAAPPRPGLLEQAMMGGRPPPGGRRQGGRAAPVRARGAGPTGHRLRAYGSV